MRRHPLLFMFGFAAGYLPILFLLAKTGVTQQVASVETTPEAITVILQTSGPLVTPGGVVLAASESVEPVNTPEPTAEPTEEPEPTPEPTETPTPVPTATPDVWPPAEFAGWFNQYAGQYGVDVNTLERIANCESHFNPTAESGNYLGMFQFSASTWQTYRTQMGLDVSLELRANPEESIRTAAYVVFKRGTEPWPSCLR